MLNLDSTNDIFKLLRSGGSGDSGRGPVVLENPGHGELGLGALKLSCNLGESLEHFDILWLILLREVLLELGLNEGEVLEKAQPGVLWDPLIVSPSEDTSEQRAPDSSAVPVVVEQPGVVDLHLVPDEHVVLALVRDWWNEVILIADREALEDVCGAPLASSPVVDQPLLDEPVEGPDGFFERCAVIKSVAEDDIGVVLLESGETSLDSLDDVLSGEPDVIRIL